MFVNDTNIFACHKNVDQVISIVSTELTNVVNWQTINKFSLNVK